jgi:uncharacterized protein YpmB
MENKKTLYVIIGVVVLIIVVGGMFFFANKGGQKNIQPSASNQEAQMPSPSSQTTTPSQEAQITPVTETTTMVDCGTGGDPFCFVGRANSCLPVKAKMVSSDNKTEIELIVLGIENDKCHFQRKLNGTLNLNCYFPKGTNIMNAIDQTFGNDHGLQKVVDDSCGGW